MTSNFIRAELQGAIEFTILGYLARTNVLRVAGKIYVQHYAIVKQDALAECWSYGRNLTVIAELGCLFNVGSCSEIYLEKCFQEAGLAVAERLPNSLMFLVHPTVTTEQIPGCLEAVRSVVKQACR
ncbi:hypothetical protein MITS9509_00336 [Synechococcus sp. MIT S9509]|uniref:hypothetical protein n=1 Tax=Synechococcus sp. MIT S9509 TaxID=1801630 RepID=UPI0007BB3E82|nr:hypothetical protein [Synechococcus sp. MIT S9509]KZR93741.1 hypothetical protein MITS9509_00336 [Synechococcus sp. MIT S9509]